MTRDLKQRWVEALRSGKYKQGVGRLRGEDPLIKDGPDDCFCALGVLVDIADPCGWCWSGRSWSYRSNPVSARRLIDIGVITGKVHDEVIDLNDVLGLTFSEIADRIEADFPTEEKTSE